MVKCAYNHVSIDVKDIEEAVEFYSDLFDMERVPSPEFGSGIAIEWMEFGDQQLHLVERDTPPPENHHFALTVDDFEGVYREAKERGILRGDSPPHAFPNGVVQAYLRDPTGNLVEITYPDIEALDPDVAEEVEYIDVEPATDEPAGSHIARSVYAFES